MTAIALAHIVVLLSMAFMLWKGQTGFLKKVFWPALLLKLLAGIGLGIVYTRYYTVGDTFGYFSDGATLAALAKKDLATYFDFLWRGDETFRIWSSLNFQQPRALFFAKITSVFNLLSGDNYWIISLYFSFLSFCCSWWLVRALAKFYPAAEKAAAFAFLFFPSIVFWTSGLVKECLAMASLYFLSTAFLKVWKAEKVRVIEWLAVPLALWFLWNLKYYYLAAFLPIASTCLVVRRIIEPHVSFRHPLPKALVWLVIFIVPVSAVSLVHPNFYPQHFLEVVVSNYETFVTISQPQDVIHYSNLEADLGSVLQYAPKALFSGLFRPFPWEAENVFQILASLENMLMLLLFITSLARWKNAVREKDRMLLFAVTLYVIVLCIFLALSTPNFGTLSRYRVGFLPFFVLLITTSNPVVDRLQRFLQR